MEIKEKIENWIKDTLKIEKVNLTHPKEIKNGDYAFFAGEHANDFGGVLINNKLPEISEIKIVGPFVNFYLSKDFFLKSIQKINELGERVGKNDLYKSQKIIIEYTDPNPFKEFHIGHLMSNAIGESISRIIEVGGAEIKRISYGGDVGLHVAKSIFVVLEKKEEIEKIKKLEDKEQIKFWSDCYVEGNNRYEEDINSKQKIDELNKIIFEKSDETINDLYKWGREVSIKYFILMFEKLDTHFDKNIWESEVTDNALKAVEEGLKNRILEKSEGAIIFRGENYGLHTRVFINSKGVPLYEAKELGLGIKKYEDYFFDKSIVITGNEQNEYFKVVLRATELIKPEVSNKTVHIGHGMLRFASGKMSSRKGNVITAENLINQVKEKILEKISPTHKVGTPTFEHLQKVGAEIVAIGAIKYSILRQGIGGDIIFDFDKSISFDGDSGPYLQYTAVRANSVLENYKSRISNFKKIFSFKFLKSKTKRPENFEITDLERYLYRFNEVVKRAGKEYAPHYIVTYLTELSSSFNSFYASNKIIDENDPTSSYKIALTQAVAHILKSGLHLLGIKVPDRM